jgi:GNAT superfamily N-acetyltransferase
VSTGLADGDVAARARRWHHARQAAVCDVLEPWPHGMVVRATRYPDYFDFNVVRVEDDPAMSVDALAAFADQALSGLSHRRVDFDFVEAAEPLRAEFEAAGWRALRLLWMRHEMAPPPRGSQVRVEHVPYEAVNDLRVEWHREDFPSQEPGPFLAQARELALRHDVQVLAVIERGMPVAFAQLERDGGAAEIAQVFVHRDHRGRGLGTAMTRAAIDAAGDVRDLWIAADDEDRPKQLYARLGFRPAWTSMEFLRLP